MRTYQKSKGTREKKEPRRTSNQNNNTPSKNQRENLPKTAKKNFQKQQVQKSYKTNLSIIII